MNWKKFLNEENEQKKWRIQKRLAIICDKIEKNSNKI
jgi:hypothetical protein